MKILEINIRPKSSINIKTEDNEFFIDIKKNSSTKGKFFQGDYENKTPLNFTVEQEKTFLDAVKEYDIELYPMIKSKIKK